MKLDRLAASKVAFTALAFSNTLPHSLRAECRLISNSALALCLPACPSPCPLCPPATSSVVLHAWAARHAPAVALGLQVGQRHRRVRHLLGRHALRRDDAVDLRQQRLRAALHRHLGERDGGGLLRGGGRAQLLAPLRGGWGAQGQEGEGLQLWGVRASWCPSVQAMGQCASALRARAPVHTPTHLLLGPDATMLQPARAGSEGAAQGRSELCVCGHVRGVQAHTLSGP